MLFFGLHYKKENSLSAKIHDRLINAVCSTVIAGSCIIYLKEQLLRLSDGERKIGLLYAPCFVGLSA